MASANPFSIVANPEENKAHPRVSLTAVFHEGDGQVRVRVEHLRSSTIRRVELPG
jgi:hypothetical protein